jgi:hypothetical protein
VQAFDKGSDGRKKYGPYRIPMKGSTVMTHEEKDAKNAPEPINETELENVSGGFELPTIIDFCKNRFQRDLCVDAPWGSCKHFSSVFVRDEEALHELKFYYEGTCAKGCFKNFLYEDTKLF